MFHMIICLLAPRPLFQHALCGHAVMNLLQTPLSLISSLVDAKKGDNNVFAGPASVHVFVIVCEACVLEFCPDDDVANSSDGHVNIHILSVTCG